LVLIYAVGFSVIKYKMGYMDIPGYGIQPTPYEVWPEKYQKAIFPLTMLFSIAWSFEMITHLEELCFWLFLINSSSVQQDWFRSIYFKVWIGGAMCALLYMPLATGLTHSDPLRSEAVTFLSGSLGGLVETLCFLPILWKFPAFLDGLKTEGVDINTIVRLTTFHELNCIRVVFRFLFVLPLFALGIDGLRPHIHINESMFWTELLTFIAAVGSVVSSAITLVIFFPRNVHSEIQARNASREKSQQMRTFNSVGRSEPSRPLSPMKNKSDTMTFEDEASVPLSKMRMLDEESGPVAQSLSFQPNRRLATGQTVEGAVLSERNLARHNYQSSNVHPFVHNFTSPIDLGYNYRTLPVPPRR